MPVLMEMIEMVEDAPSLSCTGCGVSIPLADDDFTFFSIVEDGCPAGHYIGEAGNYCDDCYPRCYCRDCDQ